LFDRFREETALFYDDEDLLDEAASLVRSGLSGVAELGALYVVPPTGQAAGESALLEALADKCAHFRLLDDPVSNPESSFVLAPDPASEAREVVREALSALESGLALHEIGVFHGADPAYRRLICEAFEAANVPVAPLPGIALQETRAGRAVLGLARLPNAEFSRGAMMDVLSVAPLRERLPGRNGGLRAQPAAWDRISREAGITKSEQQWEKRLTALISDLDASLRYHHEAGNEARARAYEWDREQAAVLRDVIVTLTARLTPLRKPQGAADFISNFQAVVNDYLDPQAEALDEVKSEIEQLGTVGAVGGIFELETFTEALGANLQAAFIRPRSLGSGVTVADYRLAPGLRFQRVILCGAYEGALPSGPGSDALIDDRSWAALRERHPFIEDAAARIQRAHDAAERAVGAGHGRVVWTAPLREPGGSRDYYPSPLMRAAAAGKDGNIRTASDLRGHAAADGWLRRGRSPLAATLKGPVVAASEAAVRWAITLRKGGEWLDPRHQYWPPIAMLRQRRSRRFTEWDGNLASMGDESWLELRTAVSPTSLENYAVCGFRYFARYLLGLRPVEEPEEREMMDAAERGTLIHKVLDRFFRTRQQDGRPAQFEPWEEADIALMMRLADEALADAEQRGLTGLGVYSAHETRTIKADLRRFLDEDTAFRRRTGAIPAQFESQIPETEVAGVTLRGVVDRVDLTPDGKSAWVIDYKTGSNREYKETITPEDPLAGGKRLQLPVYLAAAGEAREAHAAYWFVTQKGGFEFVHYDPSIEQTTAFERTLRAIVDGIRAGSFPAVSGDDNDFYGKFTNCRYCEYDRICSRRRDYEGAAKQDDPGTSPWRAIEVAALGKEND
jgi:RecB family exonuclease